MTDTTDPAALLAALQGQLAALQRAPAGASPWSATAPSAAPASIVGVSVPAKIQTPAGSLRIYLSLPAECAASPAALNAAIEGLLAAGIPLDTWSPQDRGGSGGGSWGGGGNSGGGWNRGGGYNGGGFRR